MGHRHCASCVEQVSQSWVGINQAQELGHRVMNSPWCKLWPFYLWSVPGPTHISVESETEPGVNLWSEVSRKLLFCFYTRNQACLPDIRKLNSCANIQAVENNLEKTIYKSLTLVILKIGNFCWGHQLFSCLLGSVQSQKSEKRKESHYSPPKQLASHGQQEDFLARLRQGEH